MGSIEKNVARWEEFDKIGNKQIYENNQVNEKEMKKKAKEELG